MMRLPRFALVLALPMMLVAACGGGEQAAEPTAAATTAVASPTAAAETNARVATWAEAAALLGIEGSLWEPTKTIGLDLAGDIEVLVQPQFTPVLQFVGATYGTADKGFSINEKWATTEWAADPISDIRALPVKTRTVKIGDADTPAAVQVEIFANCNTAAESASAQPPAPDATCKKKDLKKFGGQARMTVTPASTMTAPGDTTVVITTNGLTYKQLIKIIKNLQQVSG